MKTIQLKLFKKKCKEKSEGNRLFLIKRKILFDMFLVKKNYKNY